MLSSLGRGSAQRPRRAQYTAKGERPVGCMPGAARVVPAKLR